MIHCKWPFHRISREHKHTSTPSGRFRPATFEGIYFLKRSSKALRASVGRAPLVTGVLGAA
jgi:hypothetical protein